MSYVKLNIQEVKTKLSFSTDKPSFFSIENLISIKFYFSTDKNIF